MQQRVVVVVVVGIIRGEAAVIGEAAVGDQGGCCRRDACVAMGLITPWSDFFFFCTIQSKYKKNNHVAMMGFI